MSTKLRIVLITALVLIMGSAQAGFVPLDDYAIRLHGEPGGLATEPANWLHTWTPATSTLWVLNGYMGLNWHKVFSLEMWISGGTFNPSTTTVPADSWIGITPIFDSGPPSLILHGFLAIEWEPYANGWHYGFNGGICPQPDSEQFNFGTLVAGGGQIEAIDLRTTCVPGACVPEPGSLLALATGICGLTSTRILRRRTKT